MDQYPNMVIMPIIYITPMWTESSIPFIIINLSTESIFHSKCHISGFLDQMDTEICEIMNSLALEPLAVEVTVEQAENPLPYREGQFICSSADIYVHTKIDLQDAEVRTFKKSFETFVLGIPKFFLHDSEDFGHNDLVTMDRDTGDSPPISQKPYNLSLKHTAWVQKELETLERQELLSKVFHFGPVLL